MQNFNLFINIRLLWIFSFMSLSDCNGYRVHRNTDLSVHDTGELIWWTRKDPEWERHRCWSSWEFSACPTWLETFLWGWTAADHSIGIPVT